MPDSNVETKHLDGGIVQVTVKGALDRQTYRDADRTLQRCIESGSTRLLVDLEAVDFINSTGIGVLVEKFTRAREAGGDLVLLRPSEKVTDVLRLLGLIGDSSAPFTVDDGGGEVAVKFAVFEDRATALARLHAT